MIIVFAVVGTSVYEMSIVVYATTKYVPVLVKLKHHYFYTYTPSYYCIILSTFYPE